MPAPSTWLRVPANAGRVTRSAVRADAARGVEEGVAEKDDVDEEEEDDVDEEEEEDDVDEEEEEEDNDRNARIAA